MTVITLINKSSSVCVVYFTMSVTQSTKCRG